MRSAATGCVPSAAARHSAWLSLGNHRFVLVAALHRGKRPTLNRAH